MIIITALLVLIVLMNFYTIHNLNDEKKFYKDEAIALGKRVNGRNLVKTSTELERKWHERNKNRRCQNGKR